MINPFAAWLGQMSKRSEHGAQISETGYSDELFSMMYAYVCYKLYIVSWHLYHTPWNSLISQGSWQALLNFWNLNLHFCRHSVHNHDIWYMIYHENLLRTCLPCAQLVACTKDIDSFCEMTSGSSATAKSLAACPAREQPKERCEKVPRVDCCWLPSDLKLCYSYSML